MTTKFYYLIISFTLLTLTNQATFAQSGWFQVATPEIAYDLYGLYFKDINTGLANSYKTSNGGQNWYGTLFIGGYAMMFMNSSTGYLVGSGIYKTTNLGDSWIQQTNPAVLLYGVYFPDVSTGYAIGKWGEIIKTTNGGTNWILLTSPVTGSYGLHGIFFIDANTGYIAGFTTAGGLSVIIKTTNGGINWDVQNFPTGTGYVAISFINTTTGIVIGQEIAKTTDGGTTWIPKNLPVNGFLYSLHFPSANAGYAVGYGGTIIKTTDAGETWFEQTSPSWTLRTVYFINDNTGYACGSSGVILKTTDGGGPPIGIKQLGNEVPKDNSLLQNYPNPFNPTTRIQFEIRPPLNPLLGKEGTLTSLRIYDVLGREVAMIVNEQLKPGSYEVKWDGSNYPSGIYFYRLTTDGFTQTKKMLFVK
jgi:photosystem II stability/assembly factor-like uncharacterized protein